MDFAPGSISIHRALTADTGRLTCVPPPKGETSGDQHPVLLDLFNLPLTTCLPRAVDNETNSPPAGSLSRQDAVD